MSNQNKFVAALCWTGVGLAAAVFVTLGYATENDRRRHAIRPEDGCLAYVPPPAITLVLNDRTDPLTGDQPRRWKAALDSEVARLAPGSVLMIASIGPTPPTEIAFEKLCVPMPGRGAKISELQQRFQERLDAIATELEHSPSTSRSAITGTIAAAVSDAAFMAPTTGLRRIEVNTDLLENDLASAYRTGGLQLPPLGQDALKGVVVHFAVLKNERDGGLQDGRLIDAWTQWTKDGGAADVEVDAPWLGYRVAPVAQKSAK